MTTENKAHLPAPAEIAPPAPLLQQTEQTLTTVATTFFDAVEQHADAVIARYSGVVWEKLETVKGMDAACKARAELRDARTKILDKGHAAIKAPLLTVGRLADGRKDAIGKKLKAAEELIDGPIKSEEARKAAEKAERERQERARIAAIRENIAGITAMPATMAGKTAAQMRELLADLTNPVEVPEQFAELVEEAATAYMAAKDAIERLIAAAEAQEAEQRRLQEERERLAAEEQRQRQEQQRRDEEARQRQAELDRQEAELQRQREELAAQQAAATAKAFTGAPQMPEEGVTTPPTTSGDDSGFGDIREHLQPAVATVAPISGVLENVEGPLTVDADHGQRVVPPTAEQLVMVVADHYQVDEATAYGWLVASFSSLSKVA